jgi:hypothetical protein
MSDYDYSSDVERITEQLVSIDVTLEFIAAALGTVNPREVRHPGFDYALTVVRITGPQSRAACDEEFSAGLTGANLGAVVPLTPPDDRPWQHVATTPCDRGGLYITWRAPKEGA